MQMDLISLFEAQRELDERILLQKDLVGHDLLNEKILALQVELGELANEHRGFKFWSEDQEPSIKYCHACNGQGCFDTGLIEENMPYREGCGYCQGTGIEENKLLEEYVDCLHFILSIGNDFNYTDVNTNAMIIINDVTKQFNLMFGRITLFASNQTKDEYDRLFATFLGLGKLLEFEPEQVERAYYDKNKINHERQRNGY